MATKRENGTGTVTKRKDGRWEAVVTDRATGKRIRRYARSENDARELLRDMLNRIERRQAAADPRQTIRAFAEVWLADRVGHRRRPSTAFAYSQRMRDYVLPYVGGIPIGDLTEIDVEDMLDRLNAKGYSRATLKGAQNALAAMLSDLVRQRRLKTNVASIARMPENARRTKAVQVPSVESVARLVRLAEDTDYEALFALLVGTGVRIGEALAATWGDFDLDSRVWVVTRTMTRDKAGHYVLGERTKTGQARAVPLSDDVVKALRRQRSKVARQRLSAYVWLEPDLDLVFPSSTGSPLDPCNVRTRTKPLFEAAKFQGSFHAIRHWFASVAIAELKEVTVVSKVLGHSNTSTTAEIYAHLFPQDAARVTSATSERLAAALAK